MKKSKKTSKLMIISGMITLLVLLYWIWLFYMTQPATEANTYHRNETITDIDVRLAYHRGSDKLYLISTDHCYMLDTGWQNKNKTYELAEKILANDQRISVTVWKHLPRNLFDINRKGFEVYQVVALRNKTSIYWDFTNHNDYQRTERIVGTIAGIFLSVVVVTFDLFCVVADKRMVSVKFKKSTTKIERPGQRGTI